MDSNWISAKTRIPEPIGDGLTFVIISWVDENFRDYGLIYYAPCDERWYYDGRDDDDPMPNFDYWMYISEIINNAG